MTTSAVIPTRKSLLKSEDYKFLRAEGLRYIEALSGNLWTDFNTHDPGITLIEAMCYAITDLGYRTSMPIQDILARQDMNNDQPMPPLYSARNILTNNPTTITDFRKLLVDIDGIKNAWLEITDCQEVDFYADCKSSSLKYFGEDYKIDLDSKEVSAALEQIINHPESTQKRFFLFPFSVSSKVTVIGHDNNPKEIEIPFSLEMPLPGWINIHTEVAQYLNFMNTDRIDEIHLNRIDFDNSAEVWQANILVNFTYESMPYSIEFDKVVIKGVQDIETKEVLENFVKKLDTQNPILQYQKKIKSLLATKIEHSVRLRGLYEVLLQYDSEDRFGDLNSHLMYHKLIIEKEEKAVKTDIEIVWTPWNDIYHRIRLYEPFIHLSSIDNVMLDNILVDEDNNNITANVLIDFTKDGNNQSISFNHIQFIGIADITQLKEDLQNIVAAFQQKLLLLLRITNEVETTLHNHRNLCEDFKKISNISINDIGICADIMLENAASLIETQAAIIYQIEQYISPSIPFYSLKEMVNKGIPREDIFNGPKLKHGFIIDEEIAASGLNEKRFIYASDIINIIQDIPGVISIKNLMITKYDTNGHPVLPSEKWCVKIDPLQKGALNIRKSKLLFFKKDLPYVLTKDKYELMLKEVEKLRSIHERNKLVNTINDFGTPKGTAMPLDDYSPLRLSLPQTYGVGITGLPPSVSTQRRAKAKQLSAFLAFFDQLMGNYLSQLNNIGKLFSIDKQSVANQKKTYYNQFLTENDLGVTYVNAATLEDNNASIGEDSLQRLTESSDDYLDRRNRFLDHLLGRFAEDFTDYALLVFNTADDHARQDLIDDKVSFLEDYPIISAERGKAFNYKDESNLWNSANVVGLKKRVSKLLGMPDFLRQNLHCPTIRDAFEIIETGGMYSFQLKQQGNITLSSTTTFSSYDKAFEAREQSILLAGDVANYNDEKAGTKHFYQIGKKKKDTPFEALVESKKYPSKTKMKAAQNTLIKEISSEFPISPSFNTDDCQTEGMHVIEHLLLRPKSDQDMMFDVCLSEDCTCCGAEDPYSFRVSVILPYWTQKFAINDPKLLKRHYVDRILRQEAPAHVHLKICWIDNFQMRLLDIHYRRWLEENAKQYPDQQILSKRLQSLLNVLGKLRNQYPEGFLHDCDDSEEENTIILNKSFLGTYNSPES